MTNGVYRYIEDEGWNKGCVTMQVYQSEKSYIFELLNTTFRYTPSAIERMFSRSSKIVVNKKKNPHFIWEYKDSFVIYPFRGGVPFVFDKI